MDRHNRHGEERALRRIEEEIEVGQADDKRRDVATLNAILAIGRITFARLDNVDEQLDRIELAQANLMERIQHMSEELDAANAALAKVQNDVTNVQRVVGEARGQIADLQQQVADLLAAAGENAELKAGLTSIADGLNAVDASLDIEAPDQPA